MISAESLPSDRLQQLDEYWRSATYLGAAQLYLKNNVLLRRPLCAADVKERPLGHWGTQPGLNFIYAHLNRLICDTQAPMVLVVGPGHGAPAVLANLYLEGSLLAADPGLTHDEGGVTRFVRRFSWPGGAPSHVTASTPGTLNEGGELGYSLAHAFGVAFDNPDIVVACIVGDGEAETGPLAAAWHSNKFLNPRRDGAVLPILHRNGYKLSGPSVFGRMSREELRGYFEGLGYAPIFVEGEHLSGLHVQLWCALDDAYATIRSIQKGARASTDVAAPRWPVVIFTSEKGVTGPAFVHGKPSAGTFHAHGLPLEDPAGDQGERNLLEDWLRSYSPEELFDEAGTPRERVLAGLPPVELRLGRSPYANGGLLLRDLHLPALENYAIAPQGRGKTPASAMHVAGTFLRDVFKRNAEERNFRLFCPDETTSNKLDPVFEATTRAFEWPLVHTDEWLGRDGRVMEILSEHTTEGWLEGYVLSGRHGIFSCYEGFMPIVDSMVHQYAKWLKVSSEVEWRAPIASLNLMLTSHVWRQDHNGFSHQGPGFIDSLLVNKSGIVRAYFPPDANSLIATLEHCLKSRNYINLIVSGKNEEPQWLSLGEARKHCAAGASAWEWASSGGVPEIVLAACGSAPTVEIVAAAQILREQAPALAVRVVNVTDLLCLAPQSAHAHGLSAARFDELFTQHCPVVFAFHGYPRVIHELIYRRTDPQRFHVRGYREEGTTTTPFDMLVLNGMSRYQLVADAATYAPALDKHRAALHEKMQRVLDEHRRYIVENGVDMPAIRTWEWRL